MKSAHYAVFLGVCLIAGATAAQDAPAPNAAQAESREGLPDTYTGPVSAVAAIVDDKVITTFDVDQRTLMMIIGSGRDAPPDMIPQLRERALKDLVDESLKLNEVKKMEVTVDDAEIEDELKAIASSGGLDVDGLEKVLASQGVAISTLRQQVRANIAWPRLVRGRYGSRVRVSPEEVDATMERMREDATKEQFLVSEICIPVADTSRAQDYYQGALQLIEQMRRGVPFAIVAQQFSACSSAAAGGDLGWVRTGELAPEIDTVIRDLPPQSVTNPIPFEGAFMIYAVRDKRPAVVAGEPTYTLAYASAPLDKVGRNDAILALQKLPSAEACGGHALRQDLGPNIGVTLLENKKLGDIDERFRSAIDGLNRGDMTGPIEQDGYLHIAYVCDKDEGLGLPSRSAIEDRIYGRQLERIAQQYLRDVERNAMVDIKMKSPGSPNG